jgi:hypothetical protein
MADFLRRHGSSAFAINPRFAQEECLFIRLLTFCHGCFTLDLTLTIPFFLR